jgi:glutamate synthase (NADPH/NADH) large chain
MSAWAEEIAADLRTFLPKFWVVKPKAASVDSLIENLRRAA